MVVQSGQRCLEIIHEPCTNFHGRPVFQDTEINPYDLEERLEQVQSEMGPSEMGEMMEDDSSSDAVKKKP